MKWNWEHPDWPKFEYDVAPLAKMEVEFLTSAGVLLGAYKHLEGGEKKSADG